MGVATIFAVFAGPLTAVLTTRWLDDKRLKQSRRTDVFRTLMRTRRMRLTPDHVQALNLVEIEFHGQQPVIDAWKAYWAHLAQRPPSAKEEQERFFHDQDALHTKLLHAIARTLKYNMEQLDIFEGGYVPQGWLDDEQTLRALRNLLLDVLSGNRGIPVVPLNTATKNNPFPPPL